MAHIVILDGYSTNPGDLSWEQLTRFGSLEIHPRTTAAQVIERASKADIIISNKIVFDAATFVQLPKLRFITVLATGYNTIDIDAAKKAGIAVSNVRGYSTPSVAQHVFALLLNLASAMQTHHEDVQKGGWSKAPDSTNMVAPTVELDGKTMGIYGFGNIGKAVARIAMAFGMRVIAHHKHPERDATEGVEFVSLEELLKQSDALTLHAPLSAANTGIINKQSLLLMKKSAFLINTGRGGLIVEDELRWALDNQIIAGAGLDVLAKEPPDDLHVLFGLSNCIITPHVAWVTRETRARLIEETVMNVRSFLEGKPRNVVNP